MSVNTPESATIEIGGRPVGRGQPCLIVGEVAQAHDGSLGAAHAYIDAAAEAGADAIKFQTHIAEAESSMLEPWRVKFSAQDETRFDYWKRMEFSELQWRGLKEHADTRGLLFLSSPFSVEAVDLLARVGVPAWKVASGEVNNLLLLEQIAATRLPVILSNGLCTDAELDEAIAVLQQNGAKSALMQCTTAYPSPAERVGLQQMSRLRERYGCPVGLSDHSGVIYSGLAAATLGADLLEVHLTFSRRMFGPDVPASLTIEELARLVEGVRFVERALAGKADDPDVGSIEVLRRTFGRSLVARTDLAVGTLLRREHLTAKKPGTGIPVNRYRMFVGRRLRRAIAEGEQLDEDSFE